MHPSISAENVLCDFYRIFLEEKNVEKAASYLDDEIFFLGSNHKDIAQGITATKNVLKNALKRMEPLIYSICPFNLYTKKLSETDTIVQGVFEVVVCRKDYAPYEFELRLTATCRVFQDQHKILSIHSSVASCSDGSRESSPIQLSENALISFERKIHVRTADLLGKSIIGGVLGVYLEDTWPLYYISDRLLDRLGYDREEFCYLYAKDIRQLLHPDEFKDITLEVEKSANEDREYILKYRLRKQDGTYVWVSDIGRKEYSIDARVVCIGVISDITHEMEATQRLYSEIVEKENQIRLYNQLFESVLCGIVQYRFVTDGIIAFENVNPEAIRSFGYDTETFLAKKEWPLTDIIAREDWERCIPAFSQLTKEGNKRDYEYRMQQQDQSYCWVIGSAEVVSVDENGPLIQSVFLNIDKSKRAEIHNQMLSEQVEAGNMLLRMALEHTTTCEFYYYPNERIGVFPPQTRRQYSCQERYTHMPESFAADMIDEAWDSSYKQMFEYIHNGRNTGCAEFKSRNGMSWCRITMSLVSRNENNDPSFVVGIIEDITMAKEMELALEAAHSQDDLTGLLNREVGISTVKDFMRNKPPEQISAMMLLDMDNFGKLNHDEGNAFANAILQDVAKILHSETSQEDILVRLGGDEFLIFIKNCDRGMAALIGGRIANKIQNLFGSNSEISISASIGICVTAVVNEYSGLYRCAESTLHYVKENSKGCACCYLDVSNKLGKMLTQLYTGSYSFNEIEDPYGYSDEDLVSFALDLLGKSKKLDDAVLLLLSRIGKKYELDRVMVVEFNQEYLSMRFTYQWSRSSSDSNLGHVAYICREDLNAMIRLYDDEGTHENVNSTLSSMTSCLHIPIWNQGVFAGLLCLETHKKDYTWTADGKKTARELTKIIASYIMKARADSVSQAKTEFLSRMSHEIRTPMNAITGMTAIAKSVIHDHDRMLDCLNKIDYANEYLLCLVNDVLDMSRIESGKLETKFEDSDIGDLAKKLHTLLLPQAQMKNITFTLNNEYSENHPVLADVLRLNQVIVNIVGNAIKFTPEGGAITINISPQTVSEDSIQLLFSVEDTGIGISQDEIGRIFNAFEQANHDTVHKYGGTGLGLSISSRLVQMMGGMLQVKSELDKGSTFYFSLPFAYGNAPAEPILYETIDQDIADECFGLRLLLAEDNALNAEIAMTLLEMEGFIVETAEDGLQTLRKFLDAPEGYYDAILMDIRMPVMNGLEATREIRTSGKAGAHDIPIIAMTANAFDEDSQKSMETGMDGHLIKPLVMSRLLGLLRTCFIRKKTEKNTSAEIVEL